VNKKKPPKSFKSLFKFEDSTLTGLVSGIVGGWLGGNKDGYPDGNTLAQQKEWTLKN